jgi:hypothetical protein
MPDQRKPAESAQPATFIHLRENARRFLVAGELWSVYEDPAGMSRPSSLIFESDRAARRVRNYPANWRELLDEQLYVLSWSR